MLSRTADHLFWMSRYTERAENTARMLDVNYQTSPAMRTMRPPWAAMVGSIYALYTANAVQNCSNIF
jgi:uncharacterized alpha-E superfamily protein